MRSLVSFLNRRQPICHGREGREGRRKGREGRRKGKRRERREGRDGREGRGGRGRGGENGESTGLYVNVQSCPLTNFKRMALGLMTNLWQVFRALTT